MSIHGVQTLEISGLQWNSPCRRVYDIITTRQIRIRKKMYTYIVLYYNRRRLVRYFMLYRWFYFFNFFFVQKQFFCIRERFFPNHVAPLSAPRARRVYTYLHFKVIQAKIFVLHSHMARRGPRLAQINVYTLSLTCATLLAQVAQPSALHACIVHTIVQISLQNNERKTDDFG